MPLLDFPSNISEGEKAGDRRDVSFAMATIAFCGSGLGTSHQCPAGGKYQAALNSMRSLDHVVQTEDTPAMSKYVDIR